MLELTLESAKRIDKILEYLIEHSTIDSKRNPFTKFIQIKLEQIHKDVCSEISIEQLRIELKIALRYSKRDFHPFGRGGTFHTLYRTNDLTTF